MSLGLLGLQGILKICEPGSEEGRFFAPLTRPANFRVARIEGAIRANEKNMGIVGLTVELDRWRTRYASPRELERESEEPSFREFGGDA
jgi:hypothetical protein